MSAAVQCTTLAEVRQHIDRIDHAMLALLAERGAYVAQAARFKRNAAEVADPARVAQVLARIAREAEALGADPAVARATWQAMIEAFIAAEHKIHTWLSIPGGEGTS